MNRSSVVERVPNNQINPVIRETTHDSSSTLGVEWRVLYELKIDQTLGL